MRNAKTQQHNQKESEMKREVAAGSAAKRNYSLAKADEVGVIEYQKFILRCLFGWWWLCGK